MAKPRRILPGITYLITRRCSERRFFLRPDPQIKHIFEYLLGWLSKVYKIEIHAYVVMSNHYHLVLTDVEGQLPDFLRELNSLLARSINRFRNRKDSFWEHQPYNAVDLLEDVDVLSKMAYTLANPVAARLVDRARQWEGATSVGTKFGKPRKIARPGAFFSKKMPDTAELELTRPRCYRGLSDQRLEELIDQQVARCERECAAQGKAMGMSRVMAQHWNSSPETDEPTPSLRPTVAGKNKDARIKALRAYKDWLEQYKDALSKFKNGDRSVDFPKGTWWMCVRLRCSCAIE